MRRFKNRIRISEWYICYFEARDVKNNKHLRQPLATLQGEYLSFDTTLFWISTLPYRTNDRIVKCHLRYLNINHGGIK